MRSQLSVNLPETGHSFLCRLYYLYMLISTDFTSSTNSFVKVFLLYLEIPNFIFLLTANSSKVLKVLIFHQIDE